MLRDEDGLGSAADAAAAAAAILRASLRSSLTRSTSQPVDDDLPEEEAEVGEIEIPVGDDY